MESQKSYKGVIALLIIIIIVLSALCILFATGTISFKSSNVDNNETNEQNLIETVKITNFTFGKPYVTGLGGSIVNNTLVIDTKVNLECSDENVIGIQLSGYCLDTKNNKYVMEGPVGVMSFYCDNNLSHVDSGMMKAQQIFDANGNEVDTTNIKWEEIEIKYCKIDKAKYLGSDYNILLFEKELNYEKSYVENKLTEVDAQNIIKSVMKKAFNYIYGLNPECGNRDINDVINEDGKNYEASTNYKTENELKTYLHTFLSDSIITSVEDKYTINLYKEKDNKLYCLNTNKDCAYIYNETDTNYTIGSITDTEINVGGNIYYETCGNVKKSIPVNFVLKKNNNNNWVLDTYVTK